MKKKKSTKKDNIAEEKRDKERTLYNWSKMAELLRHSTCKSIERFYLSVGIPRSTFYDAVERERCMKEAHEFALERIGCDREESALEKNLGMNSIAAYSLPQFLIRWQKDTEWRSKLKNQEEEAKQNITVVMESFDKSKKS